MNAIVCYLRYQYYHRCSSSTSTATTLEQTITPQHGKTCTSSPRINTIVRMVHDPEPHETFGADLATLLTAILTDADVPTELGVFDRIQQLMKYWTTERRSRKAKRQLRDD